MKNIARHVATLLSSAWVGSLWAVGYLAVPVLFYAQPDRQLAGMLAGQMFSMVAYLGIGCAALLLIYNFSLYSRAAFKLTFVRIIVIMLLITLILQYGLQPYMAELKLQAQPLEVMHSELAARFKMMHGLSSIAYLLESLLGALLLIKIPRI